MDRPTYQWSMVLDDGSNKAEPDEFNVERFKKIEDTWLPDDENVYRVRVHLSTEKLELISSLLTTIKFLDFIWWAFSILGNKFFIF